jgi:hypothetical protein
MRGAAPDKLRGKQGNTSLASGYLCTMSSASAAKASWKHVMTNPLNYPRDAGTEQRAMLS